MNTADAAGFHVLEYGEAGGLPLLAADLSPKLPRMSVYLSAGIHGDEPAGSLALLTLMAQGWFDREIAWHILPMLNPGGMAAGTRNSPDGIDLNRDYRDNHAAETVAHKAWLRHAGRVYDAALSLHEDWEASGFYLYEMRNGEPAALGWSILQSVEAVMPIDRSPEIDGFPAVNGFLRPHANSSFETMHEWPEQLFLHRDHTALSYTFETPSSLPLETRVLAQIIAIKTTVNLLLAPRVEDAFEI
ncbi:MAG: M14 family metallocarboxypeptidase [Puniceicoccales bacterium]|nr:M14 family metallocarboxypeptidase [Puniceicoccales bacterium]